jgi:hypothetical protein
MQHNIYNNLGIFFEREQGIIEIRLGDMTLIMREELKEKLKAIKSENFKVPDDIDVFEMILSMMEYLGDSDSELRDDLIYSTLSSWIMNKAMSKEQLKQLIEIILDHKHLFYKIGERDTNSVFMRAFSVLLVATIIYVHREDAFLNKGELIAIKNKLIHYLAEEKDVRGYLSEGGWAHTTAHSADALDELALCKELEHEDLLEILKAIKNKVCINYHAYICYEDERLAYAANSLINRDLLDEEELAEWIKSFQEYKEKADLPNHFYLITNIRNFLNSLYYRLPKDRYHKLKNAISDSVVIIRRF